VPGKELPATPLDQENRGPHKKIRTARPVETRIKDGRFKALLPTSAEWCGRSGGVSTSAGGTRPEFKFVGIRMPGCETGGAVLNHELMRGWMSQKE
jgi:hypothetical protein